jgi:hypothetical protein
MKGRQIRFKGSSDLLGIIAKDGGFYWLIHPVIRNNGKGPEPIDYTKVVCVPKWNTEIINNGGLEI